MSKPEEWKVLECLVQAPFAQKRVVAMFDGFIDEIKNVVRRWTPKGEPVLYQNRIEWIEDLKDDTRNRDIDLRTVCRKAGGSAALAAGACAALGVQVEAWITAGAKEPHSEFASGARLNTLGEPPLTWALEFNTGKIMLADRNPLCSLTWKAVKERKDFERLRESVRSCDTLLVMGYAVLPHGHALYEGLLRDVLNELPTPPAVLLDLADISLKTAEELVTLEGLLRDYGRLCDTTVLLNRNEAAALLGKEWSTTATELAQRAGERLKPCSVVVHTEFQSALWENEQLFSALHSLAKTARVKTGCGDHYCAGFCLGRLAGLRGTELLKAAGLVALAYIESGESPTPQSLMSASLPKAEKLRMAVMDFDGTALDEGQHFSKRTIETLRRLKERGVLLCASTGRSFLDTLHLMEEAPYFDYAITSNGSDVHALAGLRRLAKITMEDAAALRVLDILARYPIYFEAYMDGRAWCEERGIEHLRESGMLEEYSSGNGDPVGRVKDMKLHLQKNPGHMSKIFLIANTVEKALELREALKAVDGICCTSSGPCNLELLAPGVDKAAALCLVAADSGVSAEQMLAVGDGENDLGMLRWCGIGIAMENAPEEVRRSADYICPPVGKSGMAQALELFFLQEEPAQNNAAPR